MKFLRSWTVDLFFVKNKRRAFCLLCNRPPLSQFKTYTLKKHFKRFHGSTHSHLNAEEREQLSLKLTNGFRNKFSSGSDCDSSESDEKTNCVGFPLMKASYVLANRIAKTSKPFSEGEFIKDCLSDVVELICPQEKKNIDKLTLSRRTIVRRILAIEKNLEEQLCARISEADYYSVSLDESADIRDTAQLIFFIRGINNDFEIFEEMLSFQSMMGQTTGKDMLNEFLKCMNTRNLTFNKLECVSTDGCPNLAGQKEKGLIYRLRKIVETECPNRSPLFIHCIIHQEVLCKSVLKLEHVTTVVTNIVNYIRGSKLRHRQFRQLLADIDAPFSDVYYHAHIRWLSIGEVLMRVYTLLPEIKQFLLQQKCTLFEELNDDRWLNDFAFSVDLLQHLNKLNKKLQGKNKFAHDLFSHVEKFMADLQIFMDEIFVFDLQHFPTLNEREEYIEQDQFISYSSVLERLKGNFDDRFKDFKKIGPYLNLMTDLFVMNVVPGPVKIPSVAYDVLRIQNDIKARNDYGKLTVYEFFKSLDEKKYPSLRDLAKRMFVIFGSTYNCESAFSVMKFNKSKTRSRMTDEHLRAIMRINTTNFTPDFDSLASKISA